MKETQLQLGADRHNFCRVCGGPVIGPAATDSEGRLHHLVCLHPPEPIDMRCYSCRWAGPAVRLGTHTCHMCEHPDRGKDDELHDPRDDIMSWYDSCPDWKPKQIDGLDKEET